MKLFYFLFTTLLLVNTMLNAQAPPNWVFGTNYNNSSLVQYGGITYRALKYVPGSVGGYPNTLIDYWISISKLAPGLDHNTSLAYPNALKVKSGNLYYESIATYVPIGVSVSNTNYWRQTTYDFNRDEVNNLPNIDGSDLNSSNLTPPEDNATQNTKIVRLSVRGHIGDADDERFMAFNVISPTEVLVRAIGPALGDLSSDLAPVALIDPTLLLIDEDGNDIDGFGNDNYVSSSQKDNILNLCQTLYPAIPIKEVESASINTFNAGTFYANVRDLDYLQTYGSRIGWVAVDMTDSSSSGGFSGVSCRGIVKPADGAMYAAFEIVGEPSDRRKIFIRGRGKSLSEFGVSDTLSNIMLSVNKFNTVTDETTFIRDSKTYTDEVNADEIRQESIDYFPEHLIPLDPSDPGILVELEPGYYSVDIESEDGESGVAWLGIDDVTD
ncbi:hypothetical protein OAP38_01235 [Opitutales bacterium]|nr:hypothetical protein [Opitutales bacterium]